MSLPLKTSRTLQLVTVAMLVTSLAQLVYWLFDEAHYMQSIVERQLDQYELDRRAGQDLIDSGHSADRVLAYFPALAIEGSAVTVKHEVAESLNAKRRKRLFRYGSEGTFLLLVLAGGIATLTYGLRQPAELLKRQTNFVAAVSHEFKTPIAGIKLACETILMRDLDVPTQRKLAGRMLNDAERLEAMVTNILDAGRVDEGRLKLKLEDVPLATILTPALERITQRNAGRNMVLRSELEPGVRAVCDSVALSAVIDNLLSNAVQSVAIAGGGEIVLSASSSGSEVCIEVRDDGMGFEPKEARKLFEKFYRLGNEMRRLTKGSGLGLYIVKTFVEQNGGRVLAKSTGPGQGATFCIWLKKGTGETA